MALPPRRVGRYGALKELDAAVWLKGQRVRAHAVEKPTVVRDHHGRAGEIGEGLLERAEGVDVQVAANRGVGFQV